MLRAACLIPLIGLLPCLSGAEFTEHRSWVHLNGYSHHFAAADANDLLLGVGWTRYRNSWGHVIRAWEFDLFQDSGRKLSTYVGHSWTIPLKGFSVGGTLALMHHRNFAAHNSLQTMPVVLPYVESGGARFKARLYYIPPVRRASDQQLALQLMWAR